MAWKETDAMTQRTEMMLEWRRQRDRGDVNFAALCREFEVSRQVGYKWLARFIASGESVTALADQSRLPKHRPTKTCDEIEQLVLEARRKNPSWGPRKLLRWLKKKKPKFAARLPKKSTIGKILRRHGLSEIRRKARRKTPPYTQPFGECTAPNMTWCADFKGWLRTSDGVKIYPLTITDAYSRLIVRCVPLVEPDTVHTLRVFKAAFRQYGLPNAIRTDNGPPFATVGAGGLSELSVWWITLGINHERIDKGKPQQNGRHERMHGSLNREIGAQLRSHPLSDAAKIMRAWVTRFNNERPHEALDDETPISFYSPSSRAYPCPPRPPDPPSNFGCGFTDEYGGLWIDGQYLKLGVALGLQRIDAFPLGDQRWRLSWRQIELGSIHERTPTKLVRTKTPSRFEERLPAAGPPEPRNYAIDCTKGAGGNLPPCTPLEEIYFLEEDREQKTW